MGEGGGVGGESMCTHVESYRNFVINQLILLRICCVINSQFPRPTVEKCFGNI